MDFRNSIGERLKTVRKYLGVSISALANQLEEKEHRLRDIESGKQNIPPDVLLKLRNILKIDVDWLLTGKGEMLKDTQKVSNSNFCDDDCVQIGYIEDMVASAGGGGESSDASVRMVKVSRFMLAEFKVRDFKRANLIKVFGDSMEPLFKSGDIAVVEQVDGINEVKNGNIVVATIDSDIYIKRLEKHPFGEWVSFKSENRAYEDIFIKGKELEQVKINSIVRGKMRVF